MPGRRAQSQAEAEEAVAQSLQEAEGEGEGLAATVTQGVPAIKVIVEPGNFVGGHEEGEELELDGPTAIAFIQMGYVRAA